MGRVGEGVGGVFDKHCVALFGLVGHKFQGKGGRRRGRGE